MELHTGSFLRKMTKTCKTIYPDKQTISSSLQQM